MMSDSTEKKNAIITNLLSSIDRYRKIKNFSIPIEYIITKEEYFELLLNMKSSKKGETYYQLLYGYLLLLGDFMKLIYNENQDQVDQILLFIVPVLHHEYFPAHHVLMKFGDYGSKFYIILSGSVDILVQSYTSEMIREKEYLRYLSLLYCYNEKGLLEKALNENKANYPIEINYNISIDKRRDDNQKEPRIVNIKELLSYLTPKEIHYYERRIDDKKYKEETDDGLSITVYDYISRIQNYRTKETKGIELDNDIKEFAIIGYKKVVSLKTGSKFGDEALRNQESKRTATIITESGCHFGLLNKQSFNNSIKTAADKFKFKFIVFILSTPLFNGFSNKLLQMKYINSFVNEKVIKNSIVIYENERSDHLIILKEGYYEMSMRRSLNDLGDIIDYYINKTTSIPNLSNDKRKELLTQKKILLEENKKIIQGGKSINSIFKFYHQEKDIRIKIINSFDILGFDNLCYLNYKSVYELKVLSDVGEIVNLPKDTLVSMSHCDSTLILHQQQICQDKLYRFIVRLLDIRKSLLKTYFSHHDINKFLNLDSYNLRSKDLFIIDQYPTKPKHNLVKTKVIETHKRLTSMINSTKTKIYNEVFYRTIQKKHTSDINYFSMKKIQKCHSERMISSNKSNKLTRSLIKFPLKKTISRNMNSTMHQNSRTISCLVHKTSNKTEKDQYKRKSTTRNGYGNENDATTYSLSSRILSIIDDRDLLSSKRNEMTKCQSCFLKKWNSTKCTQDKDQIADNKHYKKILYRTNSLLLKRKGKLKLKLKEK